MDYTSPGFIFFLLSGLIIFHSLPRTSGLWLLLGMSLVWGFYWKPEWALSYFFIIQLNFAFLRVLRRGYLFLILLNGVLYFLLKSDTLLPHAFRNPYGLSFFMFMLLGLVIDEWRNQNQEKLSWKEFSLMPSFFPLLMAGPIERGRHFSSELKKDINVLSSVTDGVILFTLGFLRKYFLIEPFRDLFDRILYSPSSMPTFLMIGFLSTLCVYIELSSYALMGRGIARMFGINVPLSFRPVYFSNSPTDFWQRWNITLGTWIRDYFSLPMMFRFGRKIHPYLLILLAFIIVGIWHAFELKWIIFGLFNGSMVILHAAIDKKFKIKFVGRFLGLLVIIGNGLILTDPHIIDPHAKYIFWDHMRHLFSGHFSSFALGFLFVTILIESIEEIKNNQDWFLEWPLTVRVVIGLCFVMLFIWALQADVFQLLRVNDLPIYFKI